MIDSLSPPLPSEAGAYCVCTCDAKPYFAYILDVLSMVYVVYPPSLRVSRISIRYSKGVHRGVCLAYTGPLGMPIALSYRAYVVCRPLCGIKLAPMVSRDVSRYGSYLHLQILKQPSPSVNPTNHSLNNLSSYTRDSNVPWGYRRYEFTYVCI